MEGVSRDSFEEEEMSEIAGSLGVFAVRDAKSFFDGLQEPDRYLNLLLTGEEWGGLFYETLNCPRATVEPFSRGEDTVQWRERYKLKFQQAMPEYPMLSRMWDLFEYASYRPDEIPQLREECLRVKVNAANEKALAALAKLVMACDEASKLSSGLLFVPD